MFSAFGSVAGSFVAQGSARDYARQQMKMMESMRAQGLATNQVYGLFPATTEPRKAVRCQSCAAPMRWSVCDYCGTTHR